MGLYIHACIHTHNTLRNISNPGDLMTDKYNLNTNPNEGLYDQSELQDLAIEDPHGLQIGKPWRNWLF